VELMPSRRRILYVHANNDEVGGADYCLFKMAREVRGFGWDPLVVLRKRTAIAELYERERIPVIELPLVRFRKTLNPAALLSYAVRAPAMIWRLSRLIHREQIGLVHTNDLMDLGGNLAARLAGVPSCHHIRMIVQRPAWLGRGLARISSAISTRVLCVSQGVKNAMYRPDARNIEVLYDWLDMNAVGHAAAGAPLKESLGLVPSARLVGCVGRLEPWKGQHLFLEAAELVASVRPDVHLCVVGGPTTNKETYVQTLERRRAASPYRDRITFLGQRPDVGSIMAQLDVLVHSSIAPDPLPGVVMEAMYSGALVVGARAGGVPEEVIDGASGFLYEPGSARDLAGTILRALDYHDRQQMIRNARQHVLKTFDKAVLVRKLDALYGELIGATS
jgi:glycosyltransferase involved in cell wall biosynthesis